MDDEMLDRLEIEAGHVIGPSGRPIAILGDADYLALIAVARQNTALKAELAAVRKAAAGLEAYLLENCWIGDSGWMVTGYPEAELEALTEALDAAPSTPEGADNETPQTRDEAIQERWKAGRLSGLKEAAQICDELTNESAQIKYSHGRMIASGCASRIRDRVAHKGSELICSPCAPVL